jgi:hypothetical protein
MQRHQAVCISSEPLLLLLLLLCCCSGCVQAAAQRRLGRLGMGPMCGDDADLGIKVAHVARRFLVSVVGMLPNQVLSCASCDPPPSHPLHGGVDCFVLCML